MRERGRENLSKRERGEKLTEKEKETERRKIG